VSPARERALEKLRHIVFGALGDRDAAVYLFGSMARDEARHTSDIDVAILPHEELPPAFFAELVDAIEESTIPYNVDLVDMREVSPEFREKIVRTGIKWRG
jgi:predicted nucleotidyltransferase